MFSCEDDPDGVTRVLARSGELDLAGGAEIRRHADWAVEAGIRHVVIDLSHTTYVDTSAVGALIDATSSLARSGVRLTVVLPPESRLRTIFDVMSVDRLMLLADSRE